MIYKGSGKKWAKDQVWKVVFTLHILRSGPISNVRLRYCACDQRNYYASCRKNEETGPDPCFFFFVAVVVLGP